MNHPIKIGDQEAWRRDFGEDKRYDYPLDNNSVVVDIGAFNGEFTEKILRKFGCRAVVFEPTDAIETRNASRWYSGEGTAQVFKAAAWTYDGKLKMGGESFWVSSKERYNYQEVDCVDIATHFPLQQVNLCKINIEGGEYELIMHMIASGLIAQILNLQVQFHLINGEDCEVMYEIIADALSKTHRISWRCPFVWESWERVYEPKVEAKFDIEAVNIRKCRVCKKGTIQKIKLFNPDDPDQGEVYECTECHNNVDFVN